MGSCLILIVSSWNRIAVILDRVVMVMASCLPDGERAESKNNNARQNYCGYGKLPDLVCSQLEQNGRNSRQCFYGHDQLPNRECSESEKGWRVYSNATNLSESAKEKYVPESGRQVAPSYGTGTDYTCLLYTSPSPRD